MGNSKQGRNNRAPGEREAGAWLKWGAKRQQLKADSCNSKTGGESGKEGLDIAFAANFLPIPATIGVSKRSVSW